MRTTIIALIVTTCLVGVALYSYYTYLQNTYVDISFTSDPSGAKVMVELERGSFTGHTPFTFQARKDQVGFYTATAREPYEYSLYKPYSGELVTDESKTIDIWLDRTTAEEQEIEAAEIAARRVEEEAARLAELEAQYVYYQMETNCSQGASITFFNESGDTTQHARQASGWYYGFIPRAGYIFSMAAQNECSSGYVTVKLTRDGRTLRENTSTGGYVIATISGRL